MLQRVKNIRGFSFIDIVLSVLLLSVGFIGAMTVMQNASLNTMRGDLNTLAMQLANQKMEEILADGKFRGYAYLDSVNNYPEEELTDDFSGFVRTVEITEVNDGDLTTPEPGSGIKLVKVIVKWSDADADHVTLATAVADYS